MLLLFEIRHNHHPSGVKISAKFIRRGISVQDAFLFYILLIKEINEKNESCIAVKKKREL